MRDRTAVVIGVMAGAVAGGLAGWLWLTDDGRRLRARLEPAVQDLAGRALALSASARRLQAVAREAEASVHAADARTATR